MPPIQQPSRELELKKPNETPRRFTNEDAKLAANIRMLRMSRRVSQEELGAAMGVSFQQVQKYEKGSNRVSIGKLVVIARTLRCTLDDLVKGLFDDAKMPPAEASPATLLDQSDAIRLLQAFSKIKKTKLRANLVTLVETMVE